MALTASMVDWTRACLSWFAVVAVAFSFCLSYLSRMDYHEHHGLA